jgi:hypothetical protein
VEHEEQVVACGQRQPVHQLQRSLAPAPRVRDRLAIEIGRRAADAQQLGQLAGLEQAVGA